MKYKKNADGFVVTGKEGYPVMIADEGDRFNGHELNAGEELEIDSVQMLTKIASLNEESKNHRIKAQEYSKQLAVLNEEEIADLPGFIEKARKAITVQEKLDSGGLATKEKLDEVSKQIEDAWKSKFSEQETTYVAKIEAATELAKKQKKIAREALIGTQFASSPYFSGDARLTTLTPSIANRYFGDFFSIEEVEIPGSNGATKSKVVGKFSDGTVIRSKKNPGEIANFNEAIGLILEKHPEKDHILKNQTKAGSGGIAGVSTHGAIATVKQSSAGDYLEDILSGKVVVET